MSLADLALAQTEMQANKSNIVTIILLAQFTCKLKKLKTSAQETTCDLQLAKDSWSAQEYNLEVSNLLEMFEDEK